MLSTLLPALPLHLYAQNFSEWNQSTGYKKVEYRWRSDGTKGCDLEYRNLDEKDRRKYKSRIVFQVDGDERVKNNAVVSFADPAPYLDKIPACSEITDVSVFRF